MNHAEEIWKTLVRATVDKKHPWRVVGFSTASPQGAQVRSVILRTTDIQNNRLLFYTDRRSQKVSDIQHDKRVALLFWNPKNNTQLRVCGNAGIETSEDIVNSHWARVPDHARKDYATLSAPGTVEAAGSHALLLESARMNFSLVWVDVHDFECLELKREGHSRTKWQRDANGIWQAVKLVP